MKIKASDILKKALKWKVKDELDKLPGRATQLAEIELRAIEFADIVLSEYDFPSRIQIRLGTMRGFERLDKKLSDVVGVITVYASFNSLSGRIVRMSLPIPVSKGVFYKPSIAVINGKKYVFSQGLIDRLLANLELTRPKVVDMYDAENKFVHVPLVTKPMFSSPSTSLSFLDDIVDRTI